MVANFLASCSPAQYLALGLIAVAVCFDVANGFHDTANVVTMPIYSGAIKRPWIAVAVSAVCNFAGAVTVGTGVALLITKIVPMSAVSLHLITAVLLSSLFFNVLTWWKKIPVSSSHCLIGSLLGAGLCTVGIDLLMHPPLELQKAGIALILSPLIGWTLAIIVCGAFAAGFKQFTGTVYGTTEPAKPEVLRWAQILSMCAVSYTHGANDGQKTMGIITLILFTQFGNYGYDLKHVPFWVVVIAAVAIGIGTSIGWKKVAETVAKLSNRGICYTLGASAQLTTAATIYGATIIGAPVSTTHLLNAAVVGSTQGLYGFGAAHFKSIRKIALAWVVTIPATAAVSAGLYLALAPLF
jgi:PiT family inorganic phosphate transporter